MKTKYGTVKRTKGGYYRISSRKEGNWGKLLHRVIWEDFYNKSIPKGYDIHHKDGNKENNEIWNLQCCEHSNYMRFHGMNITDEMKLKKSERFRGENNINWKDYPRIIKDEHTWNNKQLYCVRFDGKRIKSSIYKDKLIKWWNENYPDIYLEDRT